MISARKYIERVVLMPDGQWKAVAWHDGGFDPKSVTFADQPDEAALEMARRLVASGRYPTWAFSLAEASTSAQSHFPELSIDYRMRERSLNRPTVRIQGGGESMLLTLQWDRAGREANKTVVRLESVYDFVGPSPFRSLGFTDAVFCAAGIVLGRAASAETARKTCGVA